MKNNMIFEMINIFTIAPIVISAMLGTLIITGKWENEKILTSVLFVDGICIGIMSYGDVETAIHVVMTSLVMTTIYVIFRKRNTV